MQYRDTVVVQNQIQHGHVKCEMLNQKYGLGKSPIGYSFKSYFYVLLAKFGEYNESKLVLGMNE